MTLAARADAALKTWTLTGTTEYTVCQLGCESGDPLLLPPQFGDPNVPASSLGQPFSAELTIDTSAPNGSPPDGLASYPTALVGLSIDLNGLELDFDPHKLDAFSTFSFSFYPPGPYLLDIGAAYGRNILLAPLELYRVFASFQFDGTFASNTPDVPVWDRTGRFNVTLQRSSPGGGDAVEARISGTFVAAPEPGALTLVTAALALALCGRASARR